MPSPRRRFARVSASPRCPATIPEHPDEQLWVDGPRSSVCFGDQAESLSHTKTSCADRSAKPSASAVSSHTFAVQSTPSAELWVDGPAAFRTRLQDSVSDARTVGNLSSRKPVINNDAEQTATSSRPCRRSATSHGEGVSKSRPPRTSAKKNHSSPRPRHPTPPALDGRITAWVKSVQRASQPPDADLDRPEVSDVSESRVLQETESIRPDDHKDCVDVEVRDKDETSSVANSSHSLYEHQLDESLETASLRGCALISSEEDTASLSNCKVERLRDGVPDGRADDRPYNELQTTTTHDNIPVLSIPEELSKTPPVMSSCGTSKRSRLTQPAVRSASNSSRCSSSSPATHLSSSLPHRCLSSPRKNSSSHGTQSPEPSRPKMPNNAKTATPSGAHKCSDTVRERSQPSGGKKPTTGCVAEQDENVPSSHKCQKALNQKPQQSRTGGGGGSRSVDCCRVGTGNSSPRPAKTARKSCLPVAVKKTDPESGEGHCLVSPYHTVTSPRQPGAGCSTSSDNSSLLSDAVTARSKSSELELSSGYESMMRDDSEETITAHCADWTSDDNSTQGQYESLT